MISGTFQIMSARSPRCFSTPLTASVMAPVVIGPTSLARTSSVMTAEASKPLAVSQGLPAFLDAACRSRRVMSRPAA